MKKQNKKYAKYICISNFSPDFVRDFAYKPRVIVKSVYSRCLRRERNIHDKFQVYRSGCFGEIVMS